MANRIRIVQDRRTVSRVVADLECKCNYMESGYDATVINLSLKGAFLASKWQPPKNSNVVLTFKTPLLKKAFDIEGKVLRVGLGVFERGNRFRFGVRFDYTPLNLVELVNKLISQPANHSSMR